MSIILNLFSKKQFSIFLLVVLFILSSVSLFSHPASDLEAEFDHETKILDIHFDHSVGNTESHFIEEVIIDVNEQTVITHNISNQEKKTGGRLIYKIPDVLAGDIVRIKVNCNRIGSKEIKWTIK